MPCFSKRGQFNSKQNNLIKIGLRVEGVSETNSPTMLSVRSLLLILCIFWLDIAKGFPQQGKWTLKLNDSVIGQYSGVAKNLYKGTKIFIRVNCQTIGEQTENNDISIGWILRETQVT